VSEHRFQVTLSKQFKLEAAIAEFKAAVALRGDAVINHDHNDACRKARSKAEDAFGELLDQYEYAVQEMLKPKAERKAG
jgi:hypothetical protein